MGLTFDFSGWATKNDLRCSDGRTIRKDAFKDNDGQTVPLVWQHQHDRKRHDRGDPQDISINNVFTEHKEALPIRSASLVFTKNQLSTGSYR